jgi:Pentapeptide repeats (8 copies)
MAKSSAGRWYIKQGDSVQGPFPNKLIGSYLVLGRITQETLVSQDKVHWSAARNFSAIVPEVVKESGTPQGNRALMLARIREDERSSQSEADDELHDDRREDEEEVMQLHRQIRDDVLQRYSERPKKLRVYISILILVAVVVTGFYSTTKNSNYARLADCTASAKPGINWSGCNKQGEVLRSRNLTEVNFRSAKLDSIDLSNSTLVQADLAYASMSNANLTATQLQRSNLKGANLRQANLQQADLSRANLSYAELVGAQLQGAILSKAIFDHAIWVNGETCMVGSVGACLLPASK